jgi:glutathione S-transferase
LAADETSYINYMKPLILARELDAPHVLSIIDTKSEWFYSIHPERYVPAIRDRDPVTGEDAIVFEGTACLQYLADRFDKSGEWTGRTAAEKAAVMSWTEYQTAGLGCVLLFNNGPLEGLADCGVLQSYGKVLAVLPPGVPDQGQSGPASAHH